LDNLTPLVYILVGNLKNISSLLNSHHERQP